MKELMIHNYTQFCYDTTPSCIIIHTPQLIDKLTHGSTLFLSPASFDSSSLLFFFGIFMLYSDRTFLILPTMLMTTATPLFHHPYTIQFSSHPLPLLKFHSHSFWTYLAHSFPSIYPFCSVLHASLTPPHSVRLTWTELTFSIFLFFTFVAPSIMIYWIR